MKSKKKIIVARPEREVILEFVALGRGNVAKKKLLADEIGISFSALKYKVNNFIEGNGVGRKKRSDAGIPKKDPEAKTKLEFFAELAMGNSIDVATYKLGLTEHQGNQLAKEFKQTDKFKAIRNAPQLQDLKDLIKDIFRLDIAIVDAEMHGSFNVEVANRKDEEPAIVVIPLPVRQLSDIQIILAYCLQLSKMAQIDSSIKGISDEQLINLRLNYLKQELIEKKNVTELTSLLRATKVNNPERQMDLKLVYAVIDRYNPGIDESAKAKIIREEFSKLSKN